MRWVRILLTVVAMVLPSASAMAEEKGSIIRAGDLYSQPFIDSAKVGPVAASQPVTVVERRGGWISVDAGGKRGWLRLLNVRLDSAAGHVAAATPANRTVRPQSLTQMRTGSTGRTVATGVKGLDEADIRNASVDTAQLEKLGTLAASDEEARQQASSNSLTEIKVAYLKPGKGS